MRDILTHAFNIAKTGVCRSNVDVNS